MYKYTHTHAVSTLGTVKTTTVMQCIQMIKDAAETVLVYNGLLLRLNCYS